MRAFTLPAITALTAITALLAAGLTGCGEESPPIGTLRLPLSVEMVQSAEALSLVAVAGRSEVELWRFPDPDDPGAGAPDEAVFDLDAGLYDALELRGTVAGRPLYFGRSAGFEVVAGEEVVVRLVVDPFGRLAVAPLGLPLDGLEVIALPRDPLPGDALEHTLIEQDGRFVADLPVGAYGLRVALPAPLGDWTTPDPLEAQVIAGGVVEIVPAFGPPDAELEPPEIPTRLDLTVEGARGLLGTAIDLTVRALDDDGRTVPGYDNEVRFAAEITRVLGLDRADVMISLPGAHRFDPETDRGAHYVADGLLVSLAGLLSVVATVEVRLAVHDDALGLSASVDLCLRGLLGGCSGG